VGQPPNCAGWGEPGDFHDRLKRCGSGNAMM
jgi:hypothetical protein